MCVHLKTVVLSKEAIKRSFFELLEHLEIRISGIDYGPTLDRRSDFLRNASVYYLSNKSKLFHARKLKTSYKGVHHILHRIVQSDSNHDTKRSGRLQCTTVRVDKNIRISGLRNICLAGPFMK